MLSIYQISQSSSSSVQALILHSVATSYRILYYVYIILIVSYGSSRFTINEQRLSELEAVECLTYTVVGSLVYLIRGV